MAVRAVGGGEAITGETGLVAGLADGCADIAFRGAVGETVAASLVGQVEGAGAADTLGVFGAGAAAAVEVAGVAALVPLVLVLINIAGESTDRSGGIHVVAVLAGEAGDGGAIVAASIAVQADHAEFALIGVGVGVVAARTGGHAHVLVPVVESTSRLAFSAVLGELVVAGPTGAVAEVAHAPAVVLPVAVQTAGDAGASGVDLLEAGGAIVAGVAVAVEHQVAGAGSGSSHAVHVHHIRYGVAA